ncbi:MAG TPA: tRNA pseudouridine(55) synthase TruB [Lentimicrobium sp.]|nr:tRNA pseudouridine(55) synthase TruB [Lentimicrobium sp.]
MSFDFEVGEVILVNKPLGWTSFDVVNRLRIAIRESLGIKKIKVGHAGTLDPLADGLLIICTGRYTKKIEEYQAGEKEYTGTFRVGATTPSYDLEHEINKEYPFEHITHDSITEAVAGLTGEIQQVPPLFSAIKVGGRRAYKYARKEKELTLDARPVTISEFEITGIELPDVHFRIVCSKGTYIRALARDFGEALQSGAHLIKLRRTRIGRFKLSEAKELDEIVREIGMNY